MRTNWDLVRDAASNSPTAQSSLEAVARQAWPAIFAYIRASGRTPDEATELTQGFFCDVLLGRSLLERADQGRGRFRTLLVSAVASYLKDVHRRMSAIKRAPPAGLRQLGRLIDLTADTSDSNQTSPERAFTRRFVAGMIRSAAGRLQGELLSFGDEASWEIFRLRVLAFALDGSRVTYEEFGTRFGLARGACAAKLLVAKRRFAALLIEELRNTVEDPQDVAEEIRELLVELQERSPRGCDHCSCIENCHDATRTTRTRRAT